jgi:hypothetical protein
MKIISDEKRAERNAKIAQYTLTGGALLLLAALVVNLLALSRPPDATIVYVLVLFVVGFTLTNIGTFMNQRWGRRPHKALADALRGLDDQFALYSYQLGAAHVFAGPRGVYVLLPKFQYGAIAYDGKRWINPGARRGFLGLGAAEPLGNPPAEATCEIEQLKKYLTKHAPEAADQITPQPLIVFMHTQAQVSADDSPVPVVHLKQLKEYLRKQPKDASNSAAKLESALK